MPDLDALRRRAGEVRKSIWNDASGGRVAQNIQGGVLTTISILSAIYGPTSTQLRSFQDRVKKGQGESDSQAYYFNDRVANDIEASLDAALADFDAGIASLSGMRAKGEVLGDFVVLAREALDEHSDEADRVAAVLVAASLEETLKQLGAARGIDVYSRDMRGVIEKLKEADVLAGAQFSAAHGFVKLRDNALHAQFDQISRVTTESALKFVEGLLAASFS